MIETLPNGYPSESTQRRLSNEYQHDRTYMIVKNLCVLVFWPKVASALEGLSDSREFPSHCSTLLGLRGHYTAGGPSHFNGVWFRGAIKQA